MHQPPADIALARLGIDVLGDVAVAHHFHGVRDQGGTDQQGSHHHPAPAHLENAAPEQIGGHYRQQRPGVVQLHRHADGQQVNDHVPEGGPLAHMPGRPAVHGREEEQIGGVVEQTLVLEPGVEPAEHQKQQPRIALRYRVSKHLADHRIKQQEPDQPHRQQQHHGCIGRVPQQQRPTDQPGRQAARHIAHRTRRIAIAEPDALVGPKIALVKHLGLIAQNILRIKIIK